MRIKQSKIPDVYVISPDVLGDERGFFMEVFRKDVFKKAGLGDLEFVQQNHSSSKKGVLRGLHLQWEPGLSKLIRVIKGEAFFAAVDARKNSKTVGKWVSEVLSSENKKQLFVPEGFASGFCVLSDMAEVEYHYSSLYNPKGETSIKWDDKDIGIKWPIDNPVISERDQSAESFESWLSHSYANI